MQGFIKQPDDFMNLFTRLSNWLLAAFRLQGSVFPRILPRILIFSALAAVLAYTYKNGMWTNSDNFKALTNNVACNLVLGLLLVFRTNTAYERYWSGRMAWGTLVIATRNLAREIQVGVEAPDEAAKAQKNQALKRLLGFAITTKCQLRNESSIDQLKDLLSDDDLEQIKQANRPPQLITFWLSHYLKEQEAKQHLNSAVRSEIDSRIDHLVEALSGCERIVKTPMPQSYRIYLQRLTLLYCALLPVGIVEQLGWWTPLAIALVSFVLLGIEEIGNEIEDPFNYGYNDLKLDAICETLSKDIQTAIAFGADGKLGKETALKVALTNDVAQVAEAA